MLPPEEKPQDPGPKGDAGAEPRHPFTYRAPVASQEREATVTASDAADEARRNDTVLVAAAMLMAIMFACTTIADSRILVHIKSGDYLAANGVLPFRTDMFSASAHDRPWLNLEWLFDLGLAGLHAVGGMIALTAFQVVAAIGVAILLLTNRRGDVSSWWASFVVVLSAIAAMPQLEARPTVVTLLGLASVLWVLSRYRQEIDDWSIWLLIPLFAVWSNLDPRMFLGLAALVLYGVGELAGNFLGRQGFPDGSRRARLWIAIASSIAASFLNPFFWKAPLGAWHLYGNVDPAYRLYYQNETSWIALEHLPLFQHPIQSLLDTALLASLLLGVLSLISLVLNRRRTDGGHVALWLGFFGLGMFAGREWPAAAIVFALIAIQNAEEWYRHRFRQSYGTERAELIFSRGGRGLTVLAFFAIAIFWLSGRIVPDDGRRPGVGLDALLANQVSSYSNLFDEPYDNKVFNFTPVQGDLLIWLGLKPFIDHRLDIYFGNSSAGSDNLISLHDRVRRALRSTSESDVDSSPTQKTEIWKSALERFGISQALPRLTFPNPSYQTYFDLLRSSEWTLGKLDAAAAVFLLSSPEADTYIVEHGSDFTKAAFQKPARLPDFPPLWPHRRGWEQFGVRPSPISNDFAFALHLLRHLEEAKQGNLNLGVESTFAFSYLVIRSCYQTLETDPQNLNAYRSLGQAYEILYLSELNTTGIQMRRRIYQALNAYGQALAIDPKDPITHERLVGLYLVFNKMDLAARAKQQYETLSGHELPPPSDPGIASQLETAWEKIEENITRIKEQANEALENGQSRRDVALFAWQNGCTLLALDLLDGLSAEEDQAADVVMLRSLMLLEAARPQDAYELLGSIEQVADQTGIPNWREPLALASLALPDFSRAENLWRDQATQAKEKHLMGAMNALPVGGQLHGQLFFPVWQTSQVLQALEGGSREVAEPELNAALCALEAGRVDDAEAILAGIIDRYPFSAFANLAGYYLTWIRGAPVEVSIRSEADVDRYLKAEHRLDWQSALGRLREVGPVEASRPKK